MSDDQSRGPDFRPPAAPPPWVFERAAAPRQASRRYAPPPSRGPLLVTLAVIALVLTVVSVATVAAVRGDRAAPSPPPVRATAAPSGAGTGGPSTDLGIDFVTAAGTGRLTVLDHRWREDEEDPAVLLLQVQISCASGSVDFDPFDFQTFDETGNIYEVATDMAEGSLLSVGTLRPGQAVRGQLAFLMPRGAVTLLMGDATRTITALRIPD